MTNCNYISIIIFIGCCIFSSRNKGKLFYTFEKSSYFDWIGILLIFFIYIYSIWITQILIFSAIRKMQIDQSMHPYCQTATLSTFTQASALMFFFVFLSRSEFLFKKSIELNFLYTKSKPSQLINKSFLFFLSGMPIVLICDKLWRVIIQYLQSNFVILYVNQQYLMKLVSITKMTPMASIMIVLIGIVAPITEELIFRGSIYIFLKNKINSLCALVLSSLIFATIHNNCLSLLPLYALSCLLTLSYEYKKDIRIPIALHIFFNTNTMVILHLSSSQLN